MKKFQQAFQRTHGVKWGFMDDSLINRYLTFKRSKQALVDNLNRLNMGKNIQEQEMIGTHNAGRSTGTP
jgi:hypothetical protein